MAEINKPLKDWELSLLAQRMSPIEFEQTAVEYLGLPKVEDIYIYIYLLIYKSNGFFALPNTGYNSFKVPSG